jgi:hypothetical protein
MLIKNLGRHSRWHRGDGGVIVGEEVVRRGEGSAMEGSPEKT